MKYHICIAKHYLVAHIGTHGAKDILIGWDDTDDAAIAAIEADPREVFAFDCDNQDESGHCKGHAK